VTSAFGALLVSLCWHLLRHIQRCIQSYLYILPTKIIKYFKNVDAGTFQRSFFDIVPFKRTWCKVPSTLVFDGNGGIASSVDDHEVTPFRINACIGQPIVGPKDFAHRHLGK